MTTFTLGTRGSELALKQAEWVRAALVSHGVSARVVVIKTQGDADVDRPLTELEGKGFFTKELEQALVAGTIDAAVHSLKDLPTTLPNGLTLAAVPPRVDPTEVLVTRDATVTSLAALPPGAIVGTSSLRRTAQLRYLRPDLRLVALRGNVPTRLRKVAEGRDGLDAALVAGAGLERLALAGRAAARLDPFLLMPAPGQGALGLEVRTDDPRARRTLAPLDDPESAVQVLAERSLLAALEGGCQAPIAAFCEPGGREAAGHDGGNDRPAQRRLFGRVTARDGSVQITASAPLDPTAPAATGARVAALLTAAGASRLLAR